MTPQLHGMVQYWSGVGVHVESAFVDIALERTAKTERALEYIVTDACGTKA
jgi:hypothetical protein